MKSSNLSGKLRVLELYCGIGGCAAALGDTAEVVAAIDINRKATAIYQGNFSHPTVTRTIESIPAVQFAEWGADLWWMSPPCQPYTKRGQQRDADDPRAASLLALVDRIREIRPRYVALENVPGFGGSLSHSRLRETLEECGYVTQEQVLCPTELGVPNRRRRFYLVASRNGFSPWPNTKQQSVLHRFRLQEVITDDLRPELHVDDKLVANYAGALHLVSDDDEHAVSNCFTSAYGKSILRSGSYLQTRDGFRRFSPAEILRLLCFPGSFRLPIAPARRLWPLVGNSLSVAAVRFVLSCVPELTDALNWDGRPWCLDAGANMNWRSRL